MPGLDSAIAALIASRTDMLTSLLPQGGSTSGAASQTGTSQLLVDTPPFAVPATSTTANLPPPASAQTALSNVARTLDAISRFGGQATPPATSDTPLWPNAPRPQLAASAFATLSGSLFDTAPAQAYATAPSTASAASAGSAASAASTSAVAQAAPVLPADVLASTLAKTVSESGLFYESHIAQWLAGQRTLAALNNEPQARADTLTPGLPFDIPPPPDSPPEVWIDESLLAAPFSADAASSMNPVRLVPMPLTPQQAAALAASVREVPPNTFSTPGMKTGAEFASASPDAQAHDPAVQASINAGIHPSTIPLVRQQLDLLATQQFRWTGEAWPGARFEWEIQPRQRGAQDGTASLPSGDERAWHTRVTLALPALGNIDANLVLNGQQLAVRLNASADGAVLLARDGAHFQQQLEAAGLKLTGFAIRAMDPLAESTIAGSADSASPAGNSGSAA